jgi:excisionase family DNA binding protein
MTTTRVSDPISAKDAASILDVTTAQVASLCRKGTLRAQQFGRTWVISAESVKAYKKVQATFPVVGWRAKGL